MGMTPRERLLTALRGDPPDHVPAAPDMWEMMPVRLSGRPSWEMLVYQDPPVWKGRMDACAHFGVDAFFGIGVPFPEDPLPTIVYKDDEKVIVRGYYEHHGERHWGDTAMVYTVNEPSAIVKADSIGLPPSHDTFETVTPAYNKTGREHYEDARAYVGDRGIVGACISLPAISWWPEDTYAYCEDPEGVKARIDQQGAATMERAKAMLEWKPDFLFIGNSGMMIFNPEPIFRHLTLEWMQQITRLAKEHGVLSHIHCCGVERSLVEMAASETDLDGIEPLEPPPMGDCDLRDIKQTFGDRIALKGNLHTTQIMYQGTPAQVEEACKKTIDDAAEGGGFILSTGDQTPRDTPEENIHIMRHVAETYGRY